MFGRKFQHQCTFFVKDFSPQFIKKEVSSIDSDFSGDVLYGARSEGLLSDLSFLKQSISKKNLLKSSNAFLRIICLAAARNTRGGSLK